MDNTDLIQLEDFNWVCKTIIPCIVSFIVFCYIVRSLKYLYHHFIVADHNYVHDGLKPTLSIIITAISMSLLLALISVLWFTSCVMTYVSYHETGLFPSTKLVDEYYPQIFTQTGIIGSTAVCLYFVYIPLGYLHVCKLCDQLFVCFQISLTINIYIDIIRFYCD